MPDITGMMALPDREQPARETEPDGAPSDQFAALLAAMSLPVMTASAVGKQTAAPPESASSASIEVTAIAAPAAGAAMSLPEALTAPTAPASATRQTEIVAETVRPEPLPSARPSASVPAPEPESGGSSVVPVAVTTTVFAGANKQANDAEDIARPAEPSVSGSMPVRERQPALRPEPERGGLIRRVIEETVRTQPEQPVAVTVRSSRMNDVRLISRAPLPGVPVSPEAVKSSPAVRVQRQPETERQKIGRVSVPADAGPEITGQNRSLKAALKPLIVEPRQPQREAAPSQTDEFSVPESAVPVPVTSHSRAEQKIETTAQAEAQTVISQAAEPVISAAEGLAPREARTLRLTLNPQELGRLEVRLTRDDDGRLSASFAAERETTRQALSAGLAELRQTLERAGLPVERLEIRHAPPPPELTGQFPGNPHGQPRQPFHEQPASDRFAALQPSREALNENLTVTPTAIADRLLSRRA